MADCYCDNGFTCSFLFRNAHSSINHMRLKLRVFHSRVLGLFDELTDSKYKCQTDNLHASVNCVVQSLKHKVHTMLEGSCRTCGRGFPDMCKQKDAKVDDNIREALGNIEVTELVVEGSN